MLSFTGWHHRLNSNAEGVFLSFYLFVPLLQREADIVKRRIDASNIERDVRRTIHNIQQGITEAADRYMAQEISSGAYLKICESIYAAPFE